MFKYKPDKLKNQTKITTLDEVHRDYVRKFESSHFQLNDNEKLLEKYKSDLDKLNKLDQSTLTIGDIKIKASLKSKINNLKNEIDDVVHYKSELDYYGSINNILACYYDILNNNPSSRSEISSDISPTLRKPIRKRTRNS
jgi:vacuolar-type H+-ATPase subunit I/STV1